MTLLPIAAPTAMSNGAPATDVASTSGDFAALLALVAGDAPMPDSAPALPEGALPEPGTPEPPADLGESGREQTVPPDAVSVVAMPMPMPVPVPVRTAASADPASPGASRPTQRPVGRHPAGPVAAGPSPVAAGPSPVAAGASPVAAGASPVAAGASPVAAEASPVAVEASPAHVDAPGPAPSPAEVPRRAVVVPPPPPVEAPGGELEALPGPVERPSATVLPPGRGRPVVNVPAPSAAVEASPALADISPALIPTGDAPRPRDADPAVVAATDAAVAAPLLGEESPVVPENLLPERRVGERPLPRADVVAPAPLPAVAVRTEAARPADAPASAQVTPPAVPEQIVSAVVPLHGRGDGRHEVTLELRPEDLGPIRVEVSVEQQTVHLTLHAAEPATGRLLSSALAELRTALADAGLRAGQLAVSPDSGSTTGRRSRSEPPQTETTRGDSTTPERVRILRPSAAGRLDLLL
jgi:flagellar hook-length control protein FliK